MIDVNGEVGGLNPTPVPETYDANGRAIITFVRNDNKGVSKLKMEAMGFNFEGTKE